MSKRSKNSLKDKIKQRQKTHSAEVETSGGGKGKRYFKLPDDAQMYKIKEGKNKIRIVPYIVGSSKHPSTDVEKGDEDYCVIVHVHKSVGVNNSDVICLKRTYGKACPICEEQQSLFDIYKETGKKQDKDNAVALYPKERVMYNVISQKEKTNEIEILEGSWYWYENEIIKEMQAYEDEEQPSLIDNLLEYRGDKDDFKGKPIVKPSNFRFIQDDEIDDTLVQKAYQLDTFLTIPTYEEVSNIFYGNDTEIEDDKEDYTKKTEIGTSQDDYEDDISEDAEEIEKEKPVESKSRRRRRDVQEKPAKEKECPCGFRFGTDWDTDDDCDDCDLHAECEKEYRK